MFQQLRLTVDFSKSSRIHIYQVTIALRLGKGQWYLGLIEALTVLSKHEWWKQNMQALSPLSTRLQGFHYKPCGLATAAECPDPLLGSLPQLQKPRFMLVFLRMEEVLYQQNNKYVYQKLKEFFSDAKLKHCCYNFHIDITTVI